MKTGINIGHEIKNAEAVTAVAKAITEIFESAKANSIEQSTIQTALNTLQQVAKIESVTIQNSNISGGTTKKVYMDVIPPEDQDE